MPEHQISAQEHARHLEVLSALPGVERAIEDAASDRVFLICNSAEPEGAIMGAAREAVRAAGLEPGGLELEVAYRSAQPPARRARFAGVEVSRPDPATAAAEVSLEWAGERYTGRAEGEASSAGEMRTTGNATVKALEAVFADARFTLVGIKAIRIFDTDLVAVLLHSPDARGRGLIGASLVTESIHHAAALAVLNATNRVLGNFLSTTE